MPDNDPGTDWKAAAHDLNNLLTIILNSADLLKIKLADSDLLTVVNNISSSSKLAAELLEDAFLSSNAPQKTKNLNINLVIKDVAASLKQKFSSKLVIESNLQTDLKLIKARYSECFRIFLNLIINSAEAIAVNGIISISTKNVIVDSKNDFVEITVKDNGKGIKEDDLGNIFNSGFSSKQGSVISGIGLSYVKNSVEKYSGSISVKSKLNYGTEFKILFPSVAGPDQAGVKNKIILIAEDEDILRQLLSELLESYGYDVEESADGHDLISKLDSGKKYDLLIIDKKMPGINGLECIEILRGRKIDTPVILASGSREDENDEKIRNLSINRIVNKPYNFENLYIIIRELTG